MNSLSLESDLRTRVFLACQTNDERAVHALAATGAPFDCVGPQGEPACLIAARAGSDRALFAMAQSGINPFAEHLAMRFSLHAASRQSVLSYPNSNYPHLAGQTALHSAVQSGHLRCVRVLCELGANLEARNLHGLRPIDMAVFLSSDTMLHMLCNAGSDLDAIDRSGMTALMHAARNGDSGSTCTAILLEFGAQPTIIDFSGQTALDYARASRSELTQLLLKQAGSCMGPAHSKRARARLWLSNTFDSLRRHRSNA